MKHRFLALLFVLLALLAATSQPQATSCANVIPLGFRVTPACTWIIVQHDPGVWIDNHGHYWAFPPCRADGQCSGTPVDVGTDSAALKIGR